MARKRHRSNNGTWVSSASSKTLSLKANHESSRSMIRWRGSSEIKWLTRLVSYILRAVHTVIRNL